MFLKIKLELEEKKVIGEEYDWEGKLEEFFYEEIVDLRCWEVGKELVF